MINELNNIEKLLNENVATADHSNLQIQLEYLVQQLIDRDFVLLLECLYRIDVDEKKLKAALQENKDEPAKIIMEMILERWKQKADSRAKFKQDDQEIPPAEKW
ncbi:MAG: hypothetical protein JWN76_3679 [Chitinophagaceae bacterium]|nr:hypothetical protein [Chitinophagaceae bacterium]